jgi:hypothetical protein
LEQVSQAAGIHRRGGIHHRMVAASGRPVRSNSSGRL